MSDPHHSIARLTFHMTTTEEQIACVRALESGHQFLERIVTREVIEFPDTNTLYVDAYPNDLLSFVGFVNNHPVLKGFALFV